MDEARAYYAKLTADVALGPIAAQGMARIAAGQKPERLISSATAGGAEALFGIAASLTEENSADVAVLYLRLALYLGQISILQRLSWRTASKRWTSMRTPSPSTRRSERTPPTDPPPKFRWRSTRHGSGTTIRQ